LLKSSISIHDPPDNLSNMLFLNLTSFKNHITHHEAWANEAHMLSPKRGLLVCGLWVFFPHHCVGFLSFGFFWGNPAQNYWRLSLINLSVSSPNVVMQHHATHRNSLEPRRRGFSSFPSVYSDYGQPPFDAFWVLYGPLGWSIESTIVPPIQSPKWFWGNLFILVSCCFIALPCSSFSCCSVFFHSCVTLYFPPFLHCSHGIQQLFSGFAMFYLPVVP